MDALRRAASLFILPLLLLATTPVQQAAAQFPPGQRAAVLSQSIDADTRDWQAAVIANGGSVSASWVRSVDAFVRGCKADGIWDSLLDVGLLCGADNLNGALVKIKTPSGVSRILTNNNFVSGDYTATGASAGLQKPSNATAYLDSGTKITFATTGQNLSMGLYGSAQLNNTRPMGVFRSSVYTRHYLPIDGATSAGWGIQTGSLTNPTTGFVVVSRLTGGSATRFINGGQTGTLNSDNSTPSDWSVTIFADHGSATGASNETEIIGSKSSARISFYHIGTGLTAAQVAALSNRVNALMASIGANQY